MPLKPPAGCQISTLIFEKKIVEGGVSINTPRHLHQLKTRAIPLISTPSGQELCRP
jgi:hypothetical protein